MAVGDVEIQVAVIIKVKGCASPRPPGSGDLIVARKLFERMVGRSQIHAVSITHFFAHLVVLRKLLADKAHVIEPSGCGGAHSDHVHIHFPVQIIVPQGVGHPKKCSVVHVAIGDIGKMAKPIVQV